MNVTGLVITVSLVGVVVIVVTCVRMKVFRDYRGLTKTIRGCLADRLSALVGLLTVLIFVATSFILQRESDVTPLDISAFAISALLMGIVMALFTYSVRRLGIRKSKRGVIGVAGTIVAMLTSFSP